MGGIKAKQDRDIVFIDVAFPGNRFQRVIIDWIHRTPEGHNVIRFSSACSKFKAGFFSNISRDKAVELLRRNGRNPVSFALTTGGDEFLTVRSTQIFETMQLDELAFRTVQVAQLADSFEMEGGQDVF